jgi:TPR repeat protein
MSKKHVALVVGGALVVASAAYLFFRARPAKQIPKPCRAAAPVPLPVPAPEQESVEELEVKTLSGDTKAMCKLALLHLKEDDASGAQHDVPRALDLLRNAAENGSSDAMKCESCAMFFQR